MRELLEPLTRLPGVRQVAAVSTDGVPLIVLERAGRNGEFAERSQQEGPKLSGQRIDPLSFGALAAGWSEELARAVAPLSWDAPWRLAMIASQGTLVIQQGPGAMVLIVLEPGTPPDTLSIPLDGAVARMERLLKSLGRHADNAEAPSLVEALDEDAPAAVRLDSEDTPGRNPRSGGRTHMQHPNGDFAQDR